MNFSLASGTTVLSYPKSCAELRTWTVGYTWTFSKQFCPKLSDCDFVPQICWYETIPTFYEPVLKYTILFHLQFWGGKWVHMKLIREQNYKIHDGNKEIHIGLEASMSVEENGRPVFWNWHFRMEEAVITQNEKARTHEDAYEVKYLACEIQTRFATHSYLITLLQKLSQEF